MKNLLWMSWAWMAFALLILLREPSNPMLHTAIIWGVVCGAGHELGKARKADGGAGE